MIEPRRKKRRLIALGVAVAVVVCAGAGLLVWHEQPSFCSAICHTPMDPYLPTYEAEPGSQATDKWGNEVDDASSMMAAVHRVNDAQATCMSCHVPTLSEQVSEGLTWVSGSYYYPLNERSSSDLTAARGVEADEFCLNESCHDITRDELAQLTSDLTLNPHVAQHEKAACTDCHKAHRASVNTCSQCHNDAPIPDGWLTAAESASVANTVSA